MLRILHCAGKSGSCIRLRIRAHWLSRGMQRFGASAVSDPSTAEHAFVRVIELEKERLSRAKLISH